MKQGTIVLVPFPFTENPARSKRRPAIIISNKSVNSGYDIIVAAITSNLRNDGFGFLIDKKDVTLPLPKLSEVRCHKIFTMDKRLIIKEISRLSDIRQKYLFEKIKALLDPSI